jgi:hypothetical protein
VIKRFGKIRQISPCPRIGVGGEIRDKYKIRFLKGEKRDKLEKYVTAGRV